MCACVPAFANMKQILFAIQAKNIDRYQNTNKVRIYNADVCFCQ